MATAKNFRSAFNGFNRQDVVHYIEYINNQHNAQIAQLNTQLQAARESLSNGGQDPDLLAQLEEARAKCAELEATVAKLQAQQPAAAKTDEELEAYRRAERAERMAQTRSQQIYNQANAALADACLKVDAATAQIGTIADQVTAQLRQYQEAVDGTKASFQEAAAAMYAIRPEEE